MENVLLAIGFVLVSIAALIHVMIFVLESIRWSRPSTWRGFGLRTQADADVVRPMAFNQGFYNLFLAAGIAVGLVLVSSMPQAGFALILFSAASMVLAATVLMISSPKLIRAALIQGLAPLLGSALIVVALTAV